METKAVPVSKLKGFFFKLRWHWSASTQGAMAHITIAIAAPEILILPLDEATWQMMRALCTQMRHGAQSKRKFTLCFNLKLLTSKHFRGWRCFIFEHNQFLLNQIYLGCIFQNKNRKAERCHKGSHTSSGNFLFCWNNIISRKSGKFTIFRMTENFIILPFHKEMRY